MNQQIIVYSSKESTCATAPGMNYLLLQFLQQRMAISSWTRRILHRLVHVSQSLQPQRVTKVINQMQNGILRLSLCLQMQVTERRMQTMQTRLVNIRNGGVCTIIALRNMVIDLSISVLLTAVRNTTDTLVRKTRKV